MAAPFVARGARPRMAILREQGVNGQVEMAAAFDRAGFEAIDVHMSDVIAGRVSLADFKGFAACGGFSYGDVLGGGEGWAKSILFNPRARDEFQAFFAREDSFALGVCNGCQMMSALHELIPGSEAWPRFVKNRSQQFEARLVLVEVPESPSLFFSGMAGSRIPVVTAHGEGRALFTRGQAPEDAIVAMRFVDNRGAADRELPVQPERLAPRHHRRHHRRRPLHDRDAAPRARLPHGPDVLAPGRLDLGREPLAAPLPQRPRARRLTRTPAAAESVRKRSGPGV